MKKNLAPIFGLLLILTVPAFAATVTVECAKGHTVGKAVGKLDPSANNTIRVIGTCKEDFVVISGFAQLSIVGVQSPAGPATIQGGSDASFWVVGSHLQLSNLTLDGGSFGVVCRDFSVCNFANNTFENATSVGVLLDNADGTFNGDVIQNNLNSGLTLSASRARLGQLMVTGTSAGPNNQGDGIDVQAGSTITADQLTVTGNQGAGISLIGNAHLINQFWVGPMTVSNNANGGVWVTENSSADLGGATVIITPGLAA